jgi:hypothetical protein
MRDEEGEEDDGYPELFQGDFADFCFIGGKIVGEWSRPDFRAKVAGCTDEEARQYQSLCEWSELPPVKHKYRLTCRTIEVAQVERVCVVRLPCGEEHGKYGNQSSECTNLGRAVSDSCCLEKTGQGAVEGINAMTI